MCTIHIPAHALRKNEVKYPNKNDSDNDKEYKDDNNKNNVNDDDVVDNDDSSDIYYHDNCKKK